MRSLANNQNIAQAPSPQNHHSPRNFSILNRTDSRTQSPQYDAVQAFVFPRSKVAPSRLEQLSSEEYPEPSSLATPSIKTDHQPESPQSVHSSVFGSPQLESAPSRFGPSTLEGHSETSCSVTSFNETCDQLESPQLVPESAFVSPQLEFAPLWFGHPSPQGQLEPFSLGHTPAQSPIELQCPVSSIGPWISLERQQTCIDISLPLETGQSPIPQRSLDFTFQLPEAQATSSSHGHPDPSDFAPQYLAAASTPISYPHGPSPSPTYLQRSQTWPSKYMQDNHYPVEPSDQRRTVIYDSTHIQTDDSQQFSSGGSTPRSMHSHHVPLLGTRPPQGVVAVFNDYQQYLSFMQYSTPADMPVLSILYSPPENLIDPSNLPRQNQIEPVQPMPMDLLGVLESSTRSSVFAPNAGSELLAGLAGKFQPDYDNIPAFPRDLPAIDTRTFPNVPCQTNSPEAASSTSASSSKTLVNSSSPLSNRLRRCSDNFQNGTERGANLQEPDVPVGSFWQEAL